MTETDERTEVHMTKKTTGPQNEDYQDIILKSKDATIDELIKKAKDVMDR